MRLAPVDRNKLSAAQADVLQQIEAGPRGSSRPGIGTIGPFSAFVKAPNIGGAAQAMGAAIRFAGSLPENVKEVAICTVGVFYRSKFEFAAHRALALKAGVSEQALDELSAGATPTFTAEESVAWDLASQLLNNHNVSDDTYSKALESFGEERVIELVLTIGYYTLISMTLNTFEIPLEPGMEDPFPETP